MDTMTGSKSTGKKVNLSIGKPPEEADKISNLPDAIIHHILSFLYANDIVKTSVLAKRWRYLWTSVPNIFLDDELFSTVNDESAFAHFVDGLHRLYNAPKITVYWLVAQQPTNSIFAEGWVQFAVEHNVEQLVVDVIGRVPFKMPYCNSVKFMKLKLGGGDLLLPLLGRFSMLETLSLSEVKLPGNTVLDLNASCCPVLRILSVKKCIGLISLRISCPDLEDLYIKKCIGLDQLIVFGSKLHTLSIGDSFTDESLTSFVRIVAPNLQMFTWLDFIIDNFAIAKFECLRVAHISLVIYYYNEMKEPYLRSARKFLQYFASAENLQVEMPCFWGLPTNLELLEGLATSLYNLKKLSLLVGPDAHIFRGISRLFRCFYNLEILHIHTVSDDAEAELSYRFPNASAFEHEDWTYHAGPLNNLLEVNFCGFRGRPHEMEFVQYLLDHAVILRKMSIVLSPEHFTKERKKNQITAKLMKLKRTSSEAVILFQSCMG